MDSNKNYTIAKESDGTIQITFTVSKEIVAINQNKALEELGKEIEVSGFRKGNAPIEKVKESISREKLTEKTLALVLPKMLSDALSTENIKPSVYPKFELISANDNEDWQVRSLMCEVLPFDMGDYRSKLNGLLSASAIWTPGKSQTDEKDKQMSRQEKEQKVIEFLLKDINPVVPKILVNEEVDSRLSQLLARIEKLGLTLEGYLASIGKTPQSIRDEYVKQSEDAIKIELILEKIASSEKLEVADSEIEEAIKASSTDPKVQTNLQSQRLMIKTILLRRKALDFLLGLL